MSVAITAGVAAGVEASPAPVEQAAAVVAPVTAPIPAPLPDVTQHAVPADVLAAAAAAAASAPVAAQTVTEVVQLTIVGGDLELETSSVSVALAPVPGSQREWVGTLPPVRVVDARGNGAGWTVSWTADEVATDGESTPMRLPAAAVNLDPWAPAVVDGVAAGLAAGPAGNGRPSGRVLFSAEPGTGGGTYEAGAAVSVRLPHGLAVDTLGVTLDFTVR